MQKWIDKLVGKEVTVITRNDETEHTGTLMEVDLEPQKHGLGPTVALENDDGTLTVAFDVEYIDEFYDDGDDDDDDD